MSETIPQPDVDAPAPEPEPQPDPAPAEGEQPEEQQQEDDPHARAVKNLERRIARRNAQLASERAERARLAAEVEALRRGVPMAAPEPELTPEQQAVVERLAAQRAAEATMREKVRAFHEQGGAAYGDWQEKCQVLQDCGVDAQFSHLLVGMRDGAKVAASLADDPEAVQRIAAIRDPTERAVALGEYAATLRAASRPAPRAAVSRASAPIRPVSGTVTPQFNEYTASSEELVAYYSKLAMDRRMGR